MRLRGPGERILHHILLTNETKVLPIPEGYPSSTVDLDAVLVKLADLYHETSPVPPEGLVAEEVLN